jgi:hypothetical protein
MEYDYEITMARALISICTAIKDLNDEARKTMPEVIKDLEALLVRLQEGPAVGR